MSAEEQAGELEPYPLKRRSLAHQDASQYCVWSKSGESREIKADTAFEAFRASGFSSIIKIERISNIAKTILPRASLAEDQSAADKSASGEPGESIQDRIRQRKNPILLPDEMDELMRALRNPPRASESAEAAPLAQPTPQEPSPSLVPPPPAASVPPSGSPSPVGLDVQGDGFDEIIPAVPAVKPPALKAEPVPQARAAASPASSASPDRVLPPERELSAEEIDALLSGK